MDVLAFCAVPLLLTAFVARPLYERTKPQAPPALDPTREVVVRALADLEIDHASGAVDDATYAAERASLEAQVAPRD
jgi:hypothetical protein